MASQKTAGHPRRRIGLALGGGGVRGLAHVGVLRVLGEAGVPIDSIAGVSMGAIVATAYALTDGFPDNLLAVVRGFEAGTFKALPGGTQPGGVWTSVRRLIDVERFMISNVFSWGVFADEKGAALATALTGDRRLEDAKVPLGVVACDLRSGESVVFRTGSAALALQASAALPGFFRPVEHEGRLLADGGYVGVVPTWVARDMGADVVIAVDANPMYAVDDIQNGLYATLRALDITSQRYKEALLEDADVVIRPDFGGPVETLDFSRIDECIEAGRRAARDALPALASLRSTPRRARRWWRLW
jgi:NTE family protein